METNPQDSSLDPFAAADSAQPMIRAYYGQIELDIWFCALVKGKGKVPYDPNVHQSRSTAVNISVLPLPEQNVTFGLRREIIAESQEWVKITWESLKALGLKSTREAQGKWVKMQQVASGRKYRDKKGEEKESTTFKFVALYADEDACRAAYLAETGHSGAATQTQPKVQQQPFAQPAGELNKAVPFIKAFAKMNGYDLEKTKAICKTQEIIKNAIDIESPQFAQIVAEAAVAAAG